MLLVNLPLSYCLLNGLVQFSSVAQSCPTLCDPMNCSTPFLNLPFLNSGFSNGSDGKESACNTGILGLSPASGRSPGEKNGYPAPVLLLGQYQDSPAALQGVTKSCAQLSTQHTLLNSQLKFHPPHEIITNLFELCNLFFLQYCVYFSTDIIFSP